jgi:hypothetical protein
MARAVVPPEPSWGALQAQSGRLFRRARRRPGLVVGAAVLGTLMAAGLIARRPVRQTATVALRMTEDAQAPVRLDWNDRALRGYVNEVAFSQVELLAIINRHHMFRNTPRFDPIVAVDTLRERIEVEVVQNHAIALVERDNRPRSAHVKIKYQDGDPERALAIARELGQLVVATGLRQQREQAGAAARRAEAELGGARAALASLRSQVSSSALAAYQTRSAVDVPGLRDAIRVAQARVDRAEETLASADRRLRGDEGQGSLDIQLLEAAPAPPPWPTGKRVIATATSALLVCLPLAALFVGAWDRRIYAAEDLHRLGARCVGHLALTKEVT